MEFGILEILKLRFGEWVSLGEISEHASIAEPAVRLAVTKLKDEGYKIDRDDALGFRLVRCCDRLIPFEIMRGLGTRTIGWQVVTLDSTTSTNDVAWEYALSDSREGMVIFSEEQTAGRGRMGRSWAAPHHSGLLMSVVLRPHFEAQQSNLLTAMSAVAVAEAIREHAPLHARIRWPNDITVREQKVAGILVEGRTLATGSAFVLGIGLNINARREDFSPELRETATSLSIEVGRVFDRIIVAQGLLRALDRWYRDLQFGDYGRIARYWRRLSSSLGQRVVLMENSREYRGRVLDLSLEDGLIVRLDEGVTRVFHPATVTLRQLPERPE